MMREGDSAQPRLAHFPEVLTRLARHTAKHNEVLLQWYHCYSIYAMAIHDQVTVQLVQHTLQHCQVLLCTNVTK